MLAFGSVTGPTASYWLSRENDYAVSNQACLTYPVGLGWARFVRCSYNG